MEIGEDGVRARVAVSTVYEYHVVRGPVEQSGSLHVRPHLCLKTAVADVFRILWIPPLPQRGFRIVAIKLPAVALSQALHLAPFGDDVAPRHRVLHAVRSLSHGAVD